MKGLRIVQTVALVAVTATLLMSCRTSRQYDAYPPPPPPRASLSLIIDAGPGVVISRYPDGRYYYRSPQGYIYWRGPGNRYYLDRRYVNRSFYRHNQYQHWRRHYRR